jgi:hypothetical protein
MIKILLFFAALLSGSAFAQTVTASDLVGKVPVAFTAWGNTGTANTMAIDAINQARYGLAPVADGVATTAASTFKAAGGASVPISVSGKIPSLVAAKAIAKHLAMATPYVAAGVALYDLFKELGYDTNDGGKTVTKKDPNVCTVAPCKTYTPKTGTTTYSSAGAMCQAKASTNFLGPGTFFTSCTDDGGGKIYATFSATVPQYYNAGVIGTYASSLPVVNPPQLASTQQEFLDSVAAKSGWPTSSALARTMQEAAKAGVSVEVAPQTITGPATSPGQKTVKVDAVAGTTTTTNTTNNYKYEGAKITQTQTTTTTVTNTATGAQVGTPEVKTEEPPVEDSATDTPLEDQPKLYTPKYPTGMTGVWDTKKADLKSSPLLSLATTIMPNIGSGGACPNWQVDLSFGFANYGVQNVAPPCYIWAILKAMVIVSALLLARALVFGG